MKKRMNPYLLAGLIITGVILAMTFIGIFYTPSSPTAMKYGKFRPPTPAHIFGTDNFGRDIFSRVLKGSGTTFFIALFTVLIGVPAIRAPISYTFLHSSGKTVSCRFCFASGSNNVHSQSVLL